MSSDTRVVQWSTDNKPHAIKSGGLKEFYTNMCTLFRHAGRTKVVRKKNRKKIKHVKRKLPPKPEGNRQSRRCWWLTFCLARLQRGQPWTVGAGSRHHTTRGQCQLDGITQTFHYNLVVNDTNTERYFKTTILNKLFNYHVSSVASEKNKIS